MSNLLIRNYEVGVANHPFLLAESRICAQQLLAQKSWDEVVDLVLDEGLFPTRSKTTAQSYLRALRFRLEDVPPELLELIAREDTSRFALFYVLMQKNRLLRELMEELVRDKVLDEENELSRAEAEDFFESKRANSAVLAEWSDSTWRKFWQNTLKSVLETNLLNENSSLEITPQTIPAALRTWLIKQKEHVYLHLMLDQRVTV